MADLFTPSPIGSTSSAQPVVIHDPRYEAPLKRTKPGTDSAAGQGMGSLPSTEAAIYTCPTATAATITNISLVNTYASNVTYSILFRRSGDDFSYYISTKNVTLVPGAANAYDYVTTLQAGDTIRGVASVASKVDYLISGVEESQGSGQN